MRRRRFGARRRQKRDLVWVTLPFNLAVTEALSVVALIDAFAWTAVPGLAYERATLLRIVGELCWKQLFFDGTTDSNVLYWSIQVVNSSAQAVDPTDVGAIQTVDQLHYGIRAIADDDETNPQTQIPLLQWQQLDIKVKRKLTSDTQIIIAARIQDAAGATPAVMMSGALRCLIDRT